MEISNIYDKPIAISHLHKLTDSHWCDLLNGLNLLIEQQDSLHYNDVTKWRQLIALSQGIFSYLITRLGNTVVQCDHCEGDHQYTTEPSLYGYDSETWCQSCEQSQEG